MKFRILSALLLPTLMAGQGSAAQLGVNNNNLFLEVWNGGSDSKDGRSYIRDLGVSLDDFMKAPDCYQRVLADLGDDANLASLKDGGAFPAGTVWNIQALNNDSPGSDTSSIVKDAGSDPQSPANHSGFLATVTDPGQLEDIFSVYPSFAVVADKMGTHLLSAAVSGAKAFVASDSGFYLGPAADGTWGENMGSGVDFKRDQKLGAASPMYFFTVDGATYDGGTLGNNGKAYGQWSFDGSEVKFTNPENPTLPDTCPKPKACDLPWGGTLADGKSVVAYKSSVDALCAEHSEIRICSNGNLSGDFTAQTCAAPKACDLPWGGTLASGQSVAAYAVAESADCAAAKETRSCDNGVLSGGNGFQACKPLACDLPWGGKLASGQSVTAYQSSLSADCAANQQTRVCTNGKLSGDFTQETCALPKACDLPWGGTLASGESVDAYATALGTDCAAAKETRSCDNGVLSGGHGFPTCAAPKACDLPWGGTVESGQSVAAYQYDKSPYCDRETETRVCDNGVLSGLYTQAACSITAYGPYVRIVSPNGGENWNAKSAHELEWTSVNIDPKRHLNLYFSKNGGKSWQLLKKGLPTQGKITLKPGKRRLTPTAMLAVCQPITRQTLGRCDKTDAAFAITK